MATRAKQQVPMCCIEIGFETYLMSVDDGMRVMKLMQNAIKCDQGYATDRTYIPRDEPVPLEMRIVKASQIIPRTKESTLFLENG